MAILAVVLLNGAIGFFQEYSAEKTSEALQALVPHTARVRRDGVLADIPARGVVRGDVFTLEAGDDICCDGRLVEAHDLTVDDVALTGESAPVHRTAEAARAGAAVMDAGFGCDDRVLRINALPVLPCHLVRRVAAVQRRNLR